MKRALFLVILAMISFSMIFAGCSGSSDPVATDPTAPPANNDTQKDAPAAEKVELTYRATQPEFEEKEKAIWDEYTQANPNITIKTMSVNEDQAATYKSNLANGEMPDLGVVDDLDKDTYNKYYVNLLDINYEHWDKMKYSAKDYFVKTMGITDTFCPAINVESGLNFSFWYHKDEMAKTGLDPQKSVKTMADLEKFFADLKAWVDKNAPGNTVLGNGWDAWGQGEYIASCYTTALVDMKSQQDVMLGNVKWTDKDKNPYAKYFTLMKEYYDKGYFPKEWWNLSWDKKFEADFIAKKTMVIFHGPWVWDKAKAEAPDAVLANFAMPANKDGKVCASPILYKQGAVIFKAAKDKPYYAEVEKAFKWWNSPEIVKKRAEALSFVPAIEVGGEVSLESSQYNDVVKPILAGQVPGVTLDLDLWGSFAVLPYKVPNTEDVLNNDSLAPIFGDYYSGKTTLDDLLKTLQGRWDKGVKK